MGADPLTGAVRTRDTTKIARWAQLSAGDGVSNSDGAAAAGEWPFQRLLEKLPAAAYTCDPDG
jgi:hypothetical protein